MFCTNGHEVNDDDLFCFTCGQEIKRDFLYSENQPDNAEMAAEVFGLACSNGHAMPHGMTVCPICNKTALGFESVDEGIIADPGHSNWLKWSAITLVAVMILGGITFFALPNGSAGASEPMAFHYAYPGKKCSQTGSIHDGTIIQVTGAGGKLLATAPLQLGITHITNGVPSCAYVVNVKVPKTIGTYYFRAMGDKTVYRVYRSTIDSTRNGWMVLSTVAVGVAVVAWTGSAFAAY